MGMRIQQPDGRKAMVSDILGELMFLLVRVAAGIDDDTFSGTVAEDVGVLFEGIENKGFDGHRLWESGGF